MQNSSLIPVSDWALQAPLSGYKVHVFHSIDHIADFVFSQLQMISRDGINLIQATEPHLPTISFRVSQCTKVLAFLTFSHAPDSHK